MLLDSLEDGVIEEILVFANIFDFSGVNRTQKWTRTVNFRYVLILKKLKILKKIFGTVFV